MNMVWVKSFEWVLESIHDLISLVHMTNATKRNPYYWDWAVHFCISPLIWSWKGMSWHHWDILKEWTHTIWQDQIHTINWPHSHYSNPWAHQLRMWWCTQDIPQDLGTTLHNQWHQEVYTWTHGNTRETSTSTWNQVRKVSTGGRWVIEETETRWQWLPMDN